MSTTPRKPRDTSIPKNPPKNDSVESVQRKQGDLTEVNSGHLPAENDTRGTQIVNESSHGNIQEQELPTRSRARTNDPVE